MSLLCCRRELSSSSPLPRVRVDHYKAPDVKPVGTTRMNPAESRDHDSTTSEDRAAFRALFATHNSSPSQEDRVTDTRPSLSGGHRSSKASTITSMLKRQLSRGTSPLKGTLAAGRSEVRPSGRIYPQPSHSVYSRSHHTDSWASNSARGSRYDQDAIPLEIPK